MKKLSLALSLAFGTIAFAEVPALINYQGRLVDGVGNPIVGKKEFKLDIYDSQTEGTLIYQETLPDIALDEDGAYSFQFGAGESRTETSVVVATGDGSSAFFQYVLEQTPVGVISVTDGTNTFKTGDVPTGEEPFSFTYTASLKRLNLVCNEPPAEGTNFTATFRYAESGIIGALGSAAEHWMEVTIGGEKQEPRQRLVAVPFALRAGVAGSVEGSDETKSIFRSWFGGSPYIASDLLTPPVKTIKKIRVRYTSSPFVFRIARISKANFKIPLARAEIFDWDVILSGDAGSSEDNIFELDDLDLILDHKKYYYLPYVYVVVNGEDQAYCPRGVELYFTES